MKDTVVPTGRQFSFLVLSAACAETVATAIKQASVATMMPISASIAPPQTVFTVTIDYNLNARIWPPERAIRE